jgi:DNA-binding LytR/AlgR family response regulator
MAGDARDAPLPMSVRVVIVDDELLVARRLERMTRDALGPRLAQIDCATNLTAAARLLDQADNAVVLLDLNLAGDDGFDLLRRAVAEPFQVIVVSANVDRAIEAFELGVVDFVPKPFSAARLGQALARVVGERDATNTAPRFLAATLAGRLDLIPIDSVVAIHGADDYSEVETQSGEKHLHKKTLAALERLLPADFHRVHRSHIANLKHAVRITTTEGTRRLVLSNGTHLPVSRLFAKELEARFL